MLVAELVPDADCVDVTDDDADDVPVLEAETDCDVVAVEEAVLVSDPL